MRCTTRALFLLALVAPGLVQAAGLTQHQFMSDIAQGLVSDPDLGDCLANHRNAYLMGAPFPDTGWVIFNDPLSETAHRTAFIDAFVDHIRETYAYPYADQQRLIAFMLGVASHVADDPPYHSGFIQAVADHDFNGNYQLAHGMCDAGLEFIAIVDHDRWEDVPTYWLPLWDIEQVYARLGEHYDRWEFILGNMVLLVLEQAERWVADPLYRPLSRTMPWAVDNYYTYPDGGLFNGGETAAAYYEATWATLMSPGTARTASRVGRLNRPLEPAPGPDAAQEVLAAFARRCLADGTVHVPVVAHRDGSVTLYAPVIDDLDRWEDGVRALAEALAPARN